MKIVYDVVVDGGHFTETIGPYNTEKQAKNAGEEWLLYCENLNPDDEDSPSYEVFEREIQDDVIIMDFIKIVVEKINIQNGLDDGTIFKCLSKKDLEKLPTIGEIIDLITNSLRKEIISYLSPVSENMNADFCDEIESVFDALKEQEDFYRINNPN